MTFTIGDNPRMPLRRILLVALLLIAVVVGLYGLELAIPKRDYFLERRGTLVTADVSEAGSDGIVQKLVLLESSTGLRVTMRVVRPATAPGQTLPVIIVMGGEGTGKDAVDLVGAPQGVAYLALDYPYEGDQELDAFWESLTAIPGIQQAFLDSPPAMSLALDWALQQSWVDPDRIELVGASLGVPFTAVAGALDDRFRRVWLLHGGAENVPWVMHVGRRYVENEFLRGLLARAALLLVYGNSFETLDWIPEIAPRPLIIVAARDDDFVPPEAQQPFVEAAAASEHIEIVWTEGRHIRPTRREELQQLLDIVLGRIDSGSPAE
jgi:cephalosporin-C deacetylase-like acetyl esterase